MLRIDNGSSIYTPRPQVADEDTQPQSASSTQASTPPPATPQQRVDQAVAQYDTAVESKDSAAIATAKQSVYTAVAAEIGPQVDAANAHIPSQYQTTALTGQQITSYGNIILRRFEGNPTAQSVLHGAIADYQVQRQANSLIPSFYGNLSPEDKLDTLKIMLQGEPQDLVTRAMRSPTGQQILKDAVNYIAQPYDGVSSQSATEDQQAALSASSRLAAITSDLSPTYAQQIVQQSMPTIRKIAAVDANYSGPQAFANLSKVVASLGEGPQVQQLTSQIARAYQEQFNTWEGRFDDPQGGIVKFAVGGGADPKLSLALASQLQASGQTDEAGAVVRSVESGVEYLQYQVGQDVQAYSNQIKGFSWAVTHSKGVLDPSQMQTAIASYVSHQSPEWQSQFQQIQDQLDSDTRALNNSLSELQSMSGGLLAQTAPGSFAALQQSVGTNQTTQQAIEFVASRDPSLFAGSNGSAAADFWADAADRSKSLMSSVANAYIADNLLPAIKALDNPNDPRAVAQLNQVLDDFQSKAGKLLGIPPQEVKYGIDKLKDIIQTLGTTTSTEEAATAIHEYDATNKELAELKDIQFTSGPAAAAFRTLGFAIAGVAAITQIKGTLSNPTVQNIIGSFGQSVGAVQDTAAFVAKLGLLDQDGPTAKWGRAANIAGEATEKFVGLLDSAYFVAGGVQALHEGDIPSAVLDGIGVAGAGLATFGEMAGLASWAGPVGWGVTIFVQAGLVLTQQRETTIQNTAAETQFLQDAGLRPDVAQTLSSNALQEASMVQQQLGLTPAQLQTLAKNHPEVFTLAPGYTQAVINVAEANGIKGGAVNGFLDAAEKDRPNGQYIQMFFNQSQLASSPGRPLTNQANLFNMIAKQFPTAARYVAQQSPGLVGPAADERRQADVNYEATLGTLGGQQAIAGLLRSNSNSAYRAEIINIMKNNGTLENWVRAIGNTDPSDWAAARSAITAAVSAGVLPQSQADTYLGELGGAP